EPPVSRIRASRIAAVHVARLTEIAAVRVRASVQLTYREPLARLPCGSVRETVDHVVDADLVGLVGFADRTQPETRPLPELRHIGVVVDDHLQAFGWIVVLEQPAEDR